MMKKLTLILIFITAACSNTKAPSLKYDENYSRLYIDNCIFLEGLARGSYISYSPEEDFRKLEEKIFNYLRKQNLRTKTVSILYRYNTEDTYGDKSKTNWLYFGDLNVSDIKKYKNFEYFKRNTGWSMKHKT